MKNILVTGGTSYIGKHVIAQLIEKDYSVRTTVRDKSKSVEIKSDIEKHLGKEVSLDVHLADLLKDDGWDEAIKGCDAIIHVAGPFPVGYDGGEKELTGPHEDGAMRVFRLAKEHGIKNNDWFLILWGDGHRPATEPGNPDIVYGQWQRGNLARYHRKTGEIVYIQPQTEPGEKAERYNWDAPILVSNHDPKRLYFGSQRVWRSDDRGDSWKPLSSDLTLNQERLALPIMGKLHQNAKVVV